MGRGRTAQTLPAETVLSLRESQRAEVIASVANQVGLDNDVARAQGMRSLMANLDALPIEHPAWKGALDALQNWQDAIRGTKRFSSAMPPLDHYGGDAVRFLAVLAESYKIATTFWVMSQQQH